MTGPRQRHGTFWLLAATLALACAHPALAQQPGAAAPVAAPAAVAEKPLWSELTDAQKSALLPLATEWDRMDAARKLKWLDIGNRFASMKPDEQQRVHERMREWLKLTPQQRKLARENYASTKKIDKSQKSAQWQQYQQLPEEEKKKLAADAARKKQATGAAKGVPAKPAPAKPAPVKPATAVPGAPAPAAAPATAPAAPAAAPAPSPSPIPAGGAAAPAAQPSAAPATPAATTPPAAPATPAPAPAVPNVK